MRINQSTYLSKGITWGVNAARVILSLTFICSGYVKAIDPKGMAYKLDDYLSYFNLLRLVPTNGTLVMSVAISSFEFLIGIYLLFGIRRVFTSRVMVGVMVLLTPFTLFVALANPVHDCGCFGDAIILTNWQTFLKNLVLLLCSVAIVLAPRRMKPLISQSVHWMVSLFSVLYIIAFCLAEIHYLPLIDFRPYKVGVNIPEAMSIPRGKKPPVYETTFVMKKGGVEKTFTIGNYPDSTWTYVSSKTVMKEKGYVPPIIDFMVSDLSGEDVTQRLLTDTSYTCLLISPYLEQADRDVTDDINVIRDYCEDHHFKMYAVTSSGEDAIRNWRKYTGADYPILQADAILLKTMVRSNPGLILMKGGTIMGKWSCNDLPRFESDVPRVADAHQMRVWTDLVLIYVVPVMMITVASNVWTFIRRKLRKKKKTLI